MNHSVSPRRSKSLSFHQPTHQEQQPQSIQSLDLPPAISLPNSLGSLYSTLNDHLKLVKVSLKLISNNNRSGSSTHSNRSSRSNSSTTSSTTNSASSPTDQQDQDYNRLLSLLIKNEHNQPTTTQEAKNELPSLTTFVHQVTDYIHQLKLDLFSTHQIISTNSAPNSPITPLTAFSSRTDDGLYSILDPNQLVDRLTQSLRDYFSSESERISSLLPTSISDSLEQTSHQISSALRACKEEAQAVLHDGEVFIREEGEKLKGWVDHETEKLKLALHMGTSRLLTYHELPDEWKNNQFIVKGYRFIPLDRWHHLLLSGIQWHNETNRLISLIFIEIGLCRLCRYFGSHCSFSDEYGILRILLSTKISSIIYNIYGLDGNHWDGFTFFNRFFDRPESKGIRIIFFVSMAGSALIPQAHMAYLYGLSETLTFYSIENHQISMASSNFPTIALDAWSGLFIPKWLF
ncbi:hypothetical protein H4Q26_000964 [Puccinia striiformis f. sp. tritici PST-130]|nr:hypothetical protein H4Q26_000964 [Puccinia striiformis f. sp. tritici PST-130]